MKFLITGITGSLGTAVTRILLKEGHSIVGYSRDELKQQQFSKHQNVVLYLGDVRDKDRLIEASRGVNQILHFAALKHVDKLEENPEEAIQTNVLGTMNVLHAQREWNIQRVTLASTDKAAYPINAYGMSKGLAERLVLRNPNNIVCRYGNVLASRGSVLAHIVKSLREEKAVYLTDPNMSRFWITVEEAALFVIRSASSPVGGLKIPEMKSAPLYALANVVSQIMGIPSYRMEQIGHRPGEKMHECLRTSYEGEEIFTNNAVQYTEEQLGSLLRPIVEAMK